MNVWNHTCRFAVGATAALGILFMAGTAAGQAPHLHKLVAGDAEQLDELGRAVAMDGDVIVVGAPNEDEQDTNAGAAYVYRFDGSNWFEEQKLLAADGEALDSFGISVGVSGDRIAVGAHLDDDLGDRSGAAYVFEYDGATWNEVIKLVASDGGARDEFGYDLDIDGRNLLVSAHLVDSGGTDEGAVYVFSRHNVFGWLEEQKLEASDAASGDLFGAALALSGDVAVVAAERNDELDGDVGAAYVFRHDGSAWVEEQKLLPSRVERSAYFGRSVDVVDSLCVVGAAGEDHGGLNRGGIYIFRHDGGTWAEEAAIADPALVDTDVFGASVATTGTIVLAGCYLDDGVGINSGAMYSFVSVGSNWALDQKHVPGDASASDASGWAVSAQGNRCVVGAYGEDDGGSSAGAAYVFSVGEFLTTAEPGTVTEGDLLTITTSYGNAGDPVALFISEVNGAPYLAPIIIFFFAADHQFTLPITVPGGLSGIDVGLVSYKYGAFGSLSTSTQATVSFQ